jgi:hypothetical protein
MEWWTTKRIVFILVDVGAIVEVAKNYVEPKLEASFAREGVGGGGPQRCGSAGCREDQTRDSTGLQKVILIRFQVKVFQFSFVSFFPSL